VKIEDDVLFLSLNDSEFEYLWDTTYGSITFKYARFLGAENSFIDNVYWSEDGICIVIAQEDFSTYEN